MATILIVDDRPANREFLVTLLGYQNHRLLEAGDGAEALALTRAGHPDLIITDILMPAMDGYEFVRQLRADLSIAATPVVFYTAHYRKAEAEHLAKSCGVGHILIKPCEPELILRTVQEALGIALQTISRWPEEHFDRQHMRVVTDKLAETADQLAITNQRLAALIDVGLQLASERDPRHMLENVCRAARDLIGAKYALLAMGTHDSEADSYFVASGMDVETSSNLGRPAPREGVIDSVFSERKSRRLINPDGDPRSMGLPPGHPPVHTLVVAPITSMAHTYGWICLTDKVGAQEFSAEDERILGILSAQVGRIYENGSLYSKLQEQATQLERDVEERRQTEAKIARLNRVHAMISGINTLIVRVRDRQELFNQACRIAVEHGGFAMLTISVIDLETRSIAPVAWYGYDEQLMISRRLANVQGLARQAITEMRPAFSNDITKEVSTSGRLRQEAIRQGYRSAIYLPLVVEKIAKGIMTLYAKEQDFFTAEEVTLLSGLADNISFALEHIGKEEKIARLSRIQAVMSSINALIVRVRDSKELFDETCRIAVEHGGFVIAWMGTFSPESNEVTPVAWKGGASDSLMKIPRKPGARALTAIREKRAQFSNDITTNSNVKGSNGPLRHVAISDGSHSNIVLPFLVEGNAVAVLSLHAKEVNFFTEEELKLLSGLADNISFALENIGKEEKISRLSRIQAVTSNINALIVRTRDRQELLDEACRIAVEHGGFGMAWMGTFNPESNEVTPVAWHGGMPDSIMKLPRTAGTMALKAIREKHAEFNNDITAGPQVEGPRGLHRRESIRWGYRSYAVLPLVVEGSAVGMLSLIARELNFFNVDELKLLNELAGDISFALEHIARQEQLQYLSYYDELTGLPNRKLFLDRIGQHLRSRDSNPTMVALILFDLERFGMVNETLGRNGGDELLRLVAQRLEDASDGKGNLARIGANSYGVVLRGARSAADVAHAVEHQILSCFEKPYVVNGTELRISAKAGISLYPTDGDDGDTLFRNAEAALKKAKRSADHYLFYATEMNARAAQMLSLETRLRKAVDTQQFILHYQPKIEMASGNVCGLEALMRWNDPDKGLIPPVQFIPLLEETGLIVKVGLWALRQALADYRDWMARGYDAPRIAVNVSSVQLRQNDFVETVSDVIDEMKGMAHGLDIEITESLIMEDIEANIQKLKALRDMGINISIDDFGTGYSSLGYLSRLPANTLKIDRSFIINFATDADSMAIVSTIITLGHSLNMKVVAEGVETEEQSKFLMLLKCDQFQGYLFSKPLPADQLTNMLKLHRIR